MNTLKLMVNHLALDEDLPSGVVALRNIITRASAFISGRTYENIMGEDVGRNMIHGAFVAFDEYVGYTSTIDRNTRDQTAYDKSLDQIAGCRETDDEVFRIRRLEVINTGAASAELLKYLQSVKEINEFTIALMEVQTKAGLESQLEHFKSQVLGSSSRALENDTSLSVQQQRVIRTLKPITKFLPVDRIMSLIGVEGGRDIYTRLRKSGKSYMLYSYHEPMYTTFNTKALFDANYITTRGYGPSIEINPAMCDRYRLVTRESGNMVQGQIIDSVHGPAYVIEMVNETYARLISDTTSKRASVVSYATNRPIMYNHIAEQDMPLMTTFVSNASDAPLFDSAIIQQHLLAYATRTFKGQSPLKHIKKFIDTIEKPISDYLNIPNMTGIQQMALRAATLEIRGGLFTEFTLHKADWEESLKHYINQLQAVDTFTKQMLESVEQNSQLWSTIQRGPIL